MAANAIPSELQQIPNWIVWKHEEVGGRKTKIPYSTTGYKASTVDASTWTTYQDSREALEGFDGFSGQGFVFKPPYIGVDLDKCRDPQTGQTETWALDIIRMLDSYTELSPSKAGYHILLKGELPSGGNRKGPIEVYTQGRYFTITHDHVPGTPTTVNSRNLTEFHKKYILGGSTTEAPKDQSLSAVEWKIVCDIAKQLGPKATVADVTLEFFKKAQFRDKWTKNKSYVSRTVQAAIEKVHGSSSVAVAVSEPEPEEESVEDVLPEFPLIPGTIGELADALCPDVPREFKVMAAITRVGLILAGKVQLDGEPHLEPRFYTCMIAPPSAGKTAAITEVSKLIKGDFISVPSVDSGPALVDTFSDINKQSSGLLAKMLLSPDEMKDVFEKAKSSRESRNSLSSEILKLYEQHITGNRSRKNGVTEVDNAALAMLGGATPEGYSQMWMGTAGAASGLQSRFTLVTTDKVMPERQSGYDCDELVSIVQKLDGQLLNVGPTIRMTDAAWADFKSWWQLAPRDNNHCTRITDLVKRFLMVLAVTNGTDVIEPWLVKIGTEFGDYQIALRERFNPIDAHSWVQAFENRILAGYKKHGAMTDNSLRRYIRPDTLQGGYGPFLQALKNLKTAGAVIETGRTQRAIKFGLPHQRND